MTRTARWTVVVIAAALCALAIVRTTATGFSTVDADDPHYLYQGHAALDLRMPEQVDGSFPNLRAPLYGVVIAAGDSIVGGNEFVGAHLVSFALALAAIIAAVVVGGRLAGRAGAIGTAVALAVTPLVWQMLPSLRIDLVHAGAVLAVVLLAWRPTTRWWALAGVALGLTLLMKESVILLALLPVAWLGLAPHRQVLRLAGAYLGAAALTAGWWWVLVWVQVREVFPLGNVRMTLERHAGRPFDPSIGFWLLVVAAVAGWVALGVLWRHRGDARLMMVAGAAAALPAAIAWQQELDVRQYTQIAVLSCVAAGSAFGHLVAATWEARAGSGGARVALGGTAALAAVALVVVAQSRTPAEQHEAGVAVELSEWMKPRIVEHTRVVMTHRDHGELALRLHDEVYVDRIDFTVVEDPDLDDYVWLGTDRGRLLGVSRVDLATHLRAPETGYLVLTGPHVFSLPGVHQALHPGQVAPAGITPLTGIAAAGYHAHVFAVEPVAVDAELADLPITMTADAAQQWLEQRSEDVGRDIAVAELLEATPRLTGNPEDLRALGARIGRDGAAELGLPRSPYLSRR